MKEKDDDTVKPRPRLNEIVISLESATTLIEFIGTLTMGMMCALTKEPEQTKAIHDAYAELLKKKKEVAQP